MDQYYKAYKEYIQSVSQLRSHQEYMKTLRDADRGADMHDGNVQRREIDMAWVEAIEDALPSIDLAIRENRRFITQEDEIVPIEKSRKITSESVRHLAQHTNMIAKVEGDTVTPETILNIFREESFAVYENRFLRTLLDNTILFVEKRYQALSGYTDMYAADLSMDREFQFRRENSSFHLNYSVNYRERDSFDIHEDVSTLSSFERVIRIRKILADFSSSSLMRELQNSERVRPPITRTNVLQKDPNFRRTLELWNFIESYHGDGYRLVTSNDKGSMGQGIQQRLYEAMDFLRFSLRLALSPPLQESLQKNYEDELQRQAQEQQRLELERQKAEELRLKKAVAQERAEQEARHVALVAAHEAEITRKDAAHKQKMQEQEAAFVAELTRQKENFEESARQKQAEFEEELSIQQTNYETQISYQKDEFTAMMAAQREELTAEIDAQREEYTAKFTAQENRFTELFTAQKTEYNDQISTLQQKLQQTVSDMDAAHCVAMEQEKTRYEKQLSQLEEHRAKELSHLTQAHATAEAKLKQQLSATQSNSAKAEGEAKQLRELLHATEKQLSQEQQTSDALRRNLQRNTAKLQQRLENTEARYKSKLEKQERRSQRKIDKLEKKLEKALARCPYEEVLAAGEEQDLVLS